MKTENETNSSRCRSIFSLDPYWYCEYHQESWRIWTFLEAKNSFHCPVVTCYQPEPHPQAPWKFVVSGCLAKEPDVGAPAPVTHWASLLGDQSLTARYSHPAGRLIDLNPTKALCAWAGWAGSWGRWLLMPQSILKPALRGRSIFPSFVQGNTKGIAWMISWPLQQLGLRGVGLQWYYWYWKLKTSWLYTHRQRYNSIDVKIYG